MTAAGWSNFTFETIVKRFARSSISPGEFTAFIASSRVARIVSTPPMMSVTLLSVSPVSSSQTCVTTPGIASVTDVAL